jgi:hypothetical protein
VSTVPIQVRACWFDFGDPGILGGAGPVSIIRDFPSAPRTRTWYPVALANAIARTDLDPTDVDIDSAFASSFPSWYFGTDGNTPVGQWDFESVVLHEIGHGWGSSARSTA